MPAPKNARLGENAIEVAHLSKSFEVHADKRSTLKERFVRGASRRRSTFNALDDISFSVKRGTTFGLVGHNGSGKSTLLKILAGVYTPTSGAVRVADKVDALLELGAGFNGELTGRENIYLNGAILGRTKQQIDDTVDWIIDYADIGSFIDEPVKVYSSGMTVRLGFAVAVAINPRILIVDEIIAVGDEEFQRKCFAQIRKLRDSGTTIVLVTHSLSLAQEICDEVAWFDHGRLVEIGDSSTVISHYMTAVNQKEAEKRATGEESIKTDFVDRQGSGECRIVDVRFSTLASSPGEDDRTGLTTCGTARLRFTIDATAPMDEVELGIAFITDGGTTIAGPNSLRSGIAYGIPAGRSYVDYTLSDFPIQPGHYRLSTALITRGATIDYADREFEFDVTWDRVPSEPGLIRLHPGSWSPAPTTIPEGGPRADQ